MSNNFVDTIKKTVVRGNTKTVVTLKWDGKLNNHRYFSVTRDEWEKCRNGRWRESGGGCFLDDSALGKLVPEWAHLAKWHLCSTDGPMHYIGNTVYLAGDRDHWGLRKGEFRARTDRATGLPLWAPDYEGKPKAYATVASAVKPDDFAVTWKAYGHLGEGKERELDAARRCAIWPDATDEDLTAPGLEDRLRARLPKLLAEFRRDMEALGFDWNAPHCGTVNA